MYKNGSVYESVIDVNSYNDSARIHTIRYLAVSDYLTFSYQFASSGVNNANDTTNNELVIAYLRAA